MERIHVSVRARPLSADEAESSPWRIAGNSIAIPNHTTKFEFDRIFGEDCKNNEVYNVRVQDIVSAALHGFNGTVFAYGQTNSGKTHTMRGSRTEPGVICLAVRDLFDVIQQDMNREFLVRMSYMEIYNEEINDLLAPEHRKLQIHESIERGIFVAGLREEIVISAEQVIQLMEFGESHRHIGETNMNTYSSRSHSIFRMIIESREKTEGADTDAVRVSVLNLVDLAGSERAAKTGAEGVRLKEGSHINKSLMILGNVIKKLSEGVESQGGHVPYRDSKLTRILQPALGGNANTAIICNITLAQIHADETKSSLQFASRALRVTNCAYVNEIVTDAALLKRQKKEIEDLRAKLQGNHSEHLGEDILNLRNTLLKSELERERIALELEEEKKAQAEREKRLQEQAKKIENLSSMVLCSTRDEQLHHVEQRDVFKKKRRDTWCPGKLAREALGKAGEKASAAKTMTREHGMIPLLPFDDLMDKNNEPCEAEKNSRNFMSEDCTLPDPLSLLNVTSRRKARNRSKSLSKENSDLTEMQAAYEELRLQFEIHKTSSEKQIDDLKRKLGEAGLSNNSPREDNNVVTHGNVNKGSWDSEAILVIKQLQEKISMLEMERSFSQQNLESLVELATNQKITASEKYDELYGELLSAKEDAKVAHDHISEKSPTGENQDFLGKLYADVEEVMLEAENSKILVGSLSSVVDELFKCLSDVSDSFGDLECSVSESSVQLKCTKSNFEELQSWFRCQIGEHKNEKLLLLNESLDLRAQNEELNLNLQNSSDELAKISEQHEAELFELHSQIQSLQKEVFNLSASSLARERESTRKDFDKTKVKLRETESKLKNIMQEKTKLEGEKAFAERNARLLRDQKAILERDVNKQNYSVGRRHDPSADRQSSISFDSKGSRAPAAAEQAMQAECERLEVILFEAETTISSLEEDLTIIHQERDETNCRAESLASELDSVSDELNLSNKELETLRDEVSRLKLGLEESESQNLIVERSVSMLEKDKEELAMQLTDALLAMEEEKAIWSAKEKACVEAFEVKINLYTAEISQLSRGISEAKDELEISRKKCSELEDKLRMEEEKAIWSAKEKACVEAFEVKINLYTAEISQLSRGISEAQEELEISRKKCSELEDKLRISEENVVSEKEYHTTKGLEIQSLRNDIAVIHDQNSTLVEDKTNYDKERLKLRMRLRGAQMKLDAFREKFQEKAAELDYAHGEYEKSAVKMKDELARRGVEILNLRRDLALHHK